MAGEGKEQVVRQVAPVLLRMVRAHQERERERDERDRPDLGGDAA